MKPPTPSKIQLTQTCYSCHHIFHIVVKLEDYERWQSGELIQHAMTYLTPDQRELLISNTCGACFDRMFKEEEEEEEER